MTETVTMKMALASKEDFEAAYDLLGLLDNIDRGYYPADDQDEDVPTFLDEEDPEHLRVVYDRLKAIIDRCGSGAFHRIIGGFSMVCYEKNQVLDMTSDVVELHPRIKAALAAQEDMTKATRFAGLVLKQHRNDGYPGDVDGDFLQQSAIECGLIEERTVTEPCGENCSCAEVTMPVDFPTTCYFNTAAGKAAIAAADKEPPCNRE